MFSSELLRLLTAAVGLERQWRRVAPWWLGDALHASLTSLRPLLQQKLWELAKQVSEFLVWRQVICPFERDRRILQYLVTTPVFSEDGQSRSRFFPCVVLEISVTDFV